MNRITIPVALPAFRLLAQAVRHNQVVTGHRGRSLKKKTVSFLVNLDRLKLCLKFPDSLVLS